MGVSRIAIFTMALVAIASGMTYFSRAQSTLWGSGNPSRTSLVFGACLEAEPNVSQHPAYRAFCQCYADEMVARLEPREQDIVNAGLLSQGREAEEAVAASVSTMPEAEQVRFTERAKQFVASAASRCTKAAAAVTELGESAQ